MSEWKETILGDFLTFQRGFDITKKQMVEDGIYDVIFSSGVGGKHNEYEVESHGIVIGRKGTLGTVFYSEKQFWATDTTLWVKDFHGNYPKFAYYFLKTLNLGQYDCGSANPTLNRNHIHTLNIKVPISTTEQKRIADVLSCLDAKIENLRRQNETLEQIAQTLFKYWFIDFEFPNADGKPYKSSGGAMFVSELGDIPDGWRVGKLEEVGKIVCGKTSSKSEKNFYGKEIPFIKIPDMHGRIFVVDTNDGLSIDGSSSQINKLLPAYSINVSCIATVGLVTINVLPSHTNQQINSIVLNNNIFLEFLYFQCSNLSKKLNLIGSGGTATLNVSTGIFSKLDLLIPLDFVVLKYH